MVKNDFTTFVNAYNKAPEEVRALIDAPDIPIFVDKLLEKYSGWQPYRNDLVNIIVDIVLGTLSLRVVNEDLRTDKKLGVLYSPEFANEIEDFILKTRNNQETEALQDDANLTQEAPLLPQPQVDNAPDGRTAVKPMQTFPEEVDAGRAHSYGAFRPQSAEDDPDEPIHRSSQDDIIKK